MRDIFIFDIETVPDERFVHIKPKIKAPANYGVEAAAKYENDPERIRSEFAKRALKPLLGRIISVAWKLNDGPVESACIPHDEKAMLEALWEAYSAYCDLVNLGITAPPIWCANNGHGFDFPYTAWRAMLHGLNGLTRSVRAKVKWSPNHLDPSQVLRPAWHYVSQEDMCLSMGIPYDTAAGGSRVSEWFAQGQFNKIEHHNRDDVDVCHKIVTRMLESGMLSLED